MSLILRYQSSHECATPLLIYLSVSYSVAHLTISELLRYSFLCVLHWFACYDPELQDIASASSSVQKIDY